MNLKDLENVEIGRTVVVAGSGATVKEYKDKILSYIARENAKTFLHG